MTNNNGWDRHPALVWIHGYSDTPADKEPMAGWGRRRRTRRRRTMMRTRMRMMMIMMRMIMMRTRMMTLPRSLCGPRAPSETHHSGSQSNASPRAPRRI